MCWGGLLFPPPPPQIHRTPWYSGFPWNIQSPHLAHSDPNLTPGCYKTRITSFAYAAVLTGGAPQVSSSDLYERMQGGSKLFPRGFNSENWWEKFWPLQLAVWSDSFSSNQFSVVWLHVTVLQKLHTALMLWAGWMFEDAACN